MKICSTNQGTINNIFFMFKFSTLFFHLLLMISKILIYLYLLMLPQASSVASVYEITVWRNNKNK